MNISSTGKILYPDDIEVVRDIVPSVREIIGPVKLAKAFKSKKRILATKMYEAFEISFFHSLSLVATQLLQGDRIF